MPRSLTLVSVLVLVLLPTACSPVAEGSSAGPPRASGSPSSIPAAASPSAPAPADPSIPVRSCGSNVAGDISGWRRDATIIGPVGWWALSTYADAPDRFFRSAGNRYSALKAVMVVRAGPAVTVEVLQPELARLLYDPGAWTSQRRYRLDQGASVMVFEPCDGGPTTQFNGSWLVTGRVCVTVEVTVEGGEPERAQVPLGLETCG